MLDDIELPYQAITAPRATGVPPLVEADLDFLKDQPLLGFSGVASEVQGKQPSPVGFNRAQVEVHPLLGDDTSRITPLKRSAGLVEAEDIPPS